MKGSITPYTQQLLELFFRALGDEESEVLSNAAFATGLLVENSTLNLSQQYFRLLTALQPLFVVPENATSARLNAKDNACGAVARLILRDTGAMPLDQVLPLFTAALPLKNDYLENGPVFRALFLLFKTNGAALYPFMDRLLPVFAHVLDPKNADQLSDEVRVELIHLIELINREEPAKIQAAGLGAFLPSA